VIYNVNELQQSESELEGILESTIQMIEDILHSAMTTEEEEKKY